MIAFQDQTVREIIKRRTALWNHGSGMQVLESKSGNGGKDRVLWKSVVLEQVEVVFVEIRCAGKGRGTVVLELVQIAFYGNPLCWKEQK